MTRWQQVEELWGEGWSVSRIARVLGISEGQCQTELQIAQTYAERAKAKSAWERMAVALAEFYTDPKARAWIYRQMGVAEDEAAEMGPTGV